MKQLNLAYSLKTWFQIEKAKEHIELDENSSIPFYILLLEAQRI